MLMRLASLFLGLTILGQMVGKPNNFFKSEFDPSGRKFFDLNPHPLPPKCRYNPHPTNTRIFQKPQKLVKFFWEK